MKLIQKKYIFPTGQSLFLKEKQDLGKNNLSYVDIYMENKNYKNKLIKNQKFQSKKKNLRNVIFKVYKKFFIF